MTETKYEKPLPQPTPDTQPFWDYCKKHELRMQKCRQCGHVRYPPSIICPKCSSMDTEWAKLSGKGKVFSFSIFHYIYNKAFIDDMPYVAASIELEEGPVIRIEALGCLAGFQKQNTEKRCDRDGKHPAQEERRRDHQEQ